MYHDTSFMIYITKLYRVALALVPVIHPIPSRQAIFPQIKQSCSTMTLKIRSPNQLFLNKNPIFICDTVHRSPNSLYKADLYHIYLCFTSHCDLEN